jgi:hypothetical protein
MTLNKPQLFLKRLVIISTAGKIAYDEVFHQGVNIIRGENSSGKSTVLNFIFYVLGGDYIGWTVEAFKCSIVFAEVELSGAVVTLRRTVSQYGQQPLSIYWGNYETSKSDNRYWQVYPYRQTVDGTSFSNVIFNALGIPEVRTDADSNITMHQLLRLMYIDQDSPTQNLFRAERFDLPLTRQVISEVLLGAYDDQLYSNRLSLRQLIKSQEEKKQEYDGIFRVFKDAGSVGVLSNISNKLASAQEAAVMLDKQIDELRSKERVKTTARTSLEIEVVQNELSSVKNNIAKTQEDINLLEVDIADSTQFISTLEKRLFELDNSLLTRTVLGELPLTHCPQCLSPIDSDVDEHHCVLCKSKIAEDIERANAKRLRQELIIQLKESKGLIEPKRRKVIELGSSLTTLIDRGRRLQRNRDNALSSQQTTRDQQLDRLLIEKGSNEKNIEFLTEQLKIVELLMQLRNELVDIAASITSLKLTIADQERTQQNRYQTALNRIKELTLYILNNDLERQNEFKSGRVITIDFLKDTFALDGTNNFSASSKVYFKNAILFAIFFASIELDFFRYPRFILCDNMEDKGMEKERTQNFQSLILKMSEERSAIPHQIIFSTSMIAEELNNTPYCVGEFYNRQKKSLSV